MMIHGLRKALVCTPFSHQPSDVHEACTITPFTSEETEAHKDSLTFPRL